MAGLSGFLGLFSALALAAGGVLLNIWPVTPWWVWPIVGLGAAAGIIFLIIRRDRITRALASQKGRRGAAALGGVALVLAIFVFIELISFRHHARLDLTAEGIHSLAPQTVSVLESLDRKVEALAFFQEGDKEQQKAQRLLAAMSHLNRRLTFRMVDPDRQPTLAQLHGVRGYGMVVLTDGDKSHKVTPVDEQTLTNGLIKLTREREKRVLFTVGHDEHPIDSGEQYSYVQAVQELRNQSYTVSTINLLTAPGIDPQAILVLAGPKAAFAPRELELIAEFTAKGGRLMVLLDPLAEPGLDGLLAGLGVKADKTVILDRASQRLGTEPFVVVVSEYPPHALIGEFNMATFFPWVRSLSVEEKRQANLAVTEVVASGDTAWAETDMVRLQTGEAERDAADKAGPVPIAITVESVKGAEDQVPADAPAGEGFRMVVFGDSDFAANANINLVGNGDLFLQAMAWLADQGELIAIKARTSPARPAYLSTTASRLVFWLPVIVVPGIFLIAGLVVVFFRRRRA